MSLYNMLCGNNPLFAIYFAVLSTVQPISIDHVPRFRDVYTKVDDGVPQIVIYTRTGGGNRDYYETENNALAAHPLCVGDRDDDYDSTYAHFTFNVPESWREKMLTLIAAMEKTPLGATPQEKLDSMLASLKGEERKPSEPVSDDEIENLIQITTEIAAELNLI